MQHPQLKWLFLQRPLRYWICKTMNKNTVLAYATFLMILMGMVLLALAAFKYDEVAGWGFATVGIGFFAIAWVFNALKGSV